MRVCEGQGKSGVSIGSKREWRRKYINDTKNRIDTDQLTEVASLREDSHTIYSAATAINRNKFLFTFCLFHILTTVEKVQTLAFQSHPSSSFLKTTKLRSRDCDTLHQIFSSRRKKTRIKSWPLNTGRDNNNNMIYNSKRIFSHPQLKSFFFNRSPSSLTQTLPGTFSHFISTRQRPEHLGLFCLTNTDDTSTTSSSTIKSKASLDEKVEIDLDLFQQPSTYTSTFSKQHRIQRNIHSSKSLHENSHTKDTLEKSESSQKQLKANFYHQKDTKHSSNNISILTPPSDPTTHRHSHISPQYQLLFQLQLPEGTCVGLRLHSDESEDDTSSLDSFHIQQDSNHWIQNSLHPDEVQYGISLPSQQAMESFFIGRLAMRTALHSLSSTNAFLLPSHQKTKKHDTNYNACCCNDGNSVNSPLDDKLDHSPSLPLPHVSHTEPSILKDEHGRPQIPHEFLGSISHKRNTGVALVSKNEQFQSNSSPKVGIGVDIERTFLKRKRLATKVLTDKEVQDLGNLQGVTRDQEVLLRFSLKECVYKAMHPLICQFVGFKEAEITPHDNGTATVHLKLKNGAHEKFSEIIAHWRMLGDDEYFLTSSRVVLKDEYITDCT